MLLERLREALPDDVALWSEYPVNDLGFQYLDGNIHYYCLYWHTHFSKHYDHLDVAPATAPVPLNICRYAFPDVKQFIFLCGVNNWSSDSKFPFFNGEALWIEGPPEWFEPETRAEVRRCYVILHAHRDAFTSLKPEPLVPTETGGVWANRFPVKGKTVYTLYNSRHRTVRGEVLRIPHRPGATYYDEWHQRPATARRQGNDAILSTVLGPHGAGCLVVLKKR